MEEHFDPTNQGLDEAFEQAFINSEEYIAQQEQKPVDEEQVVKDAATDMIAVMQADQDPKFQNSKFLQFLKKLESGEYKIENNQLLKKNPEVNEEVFERK